TWAALTREGASRAERLRRIASLEGIYVPALYSLRIDPDTGFQVVDAPLVPEAALPVKRTVITDMAAYPFPSDGPVPVIETVFDRVSIEVARGCTEGCRFCQAGMIYRPVRERSPADIERAIELSIEH